MFLIVFLVVAMVLVCCYEIVFWRLYSGLLLGDWYCLLGGC